MNGPGRIRRAYIYTLLRLPWLAPDITTAIVNVQQPQQLNARTLMRRASRLPANWAEQRTRFVLLPGHRIDTVGVPPLIEGLAFDALIADKAFDSNALIADLDARGAKVVVSQHPRRAKPLAIDEEMYKWRHLIENFFGKLKEFKRIALRADKTDQSFAAMIHLTAAVINSR